MDYILFKDRSKSKFKKNVYSYEIYRDRPRLWFKSIHMVLLHTDLLSVLMYNY